RSDRDRSSDVCSSDLPGTSRRGRTSRSSTRARAGRSGTPSPSRRIDRGRVTLLLQAVVNGLEMGFLYALVAVGLTIIWGLMEMKIGRASCRERGESGD